MADYGGFYRLDRVQTDGFVGVDPVFVHPKWRRLSKKPLPRGEGLE